MIKRRTLLGIISLLTLSLGLSFQNCSNVKFSEGLAEQSQAVNGSPDAPIGDNPQNPVQPPVLVCDPFDTKNIVDSKQGLEGRIYSAQSRLLVADCANGVTCTSRDYISKGNKLDVALFMNRVFVPTRNFTDGFEAGNVRLEDANKNLLVEWFALDLKSNFQLASNEEEGMYQVALVADDGVTLSVNNQDILIDDNEHAPRLACASQVLALKRGDKVPFRLTYFQGPRTQIALVALWRKVELGQNLADCGSSDGRLSSAENLPQALSDKGWKVMKPENFYINGSNRCALAVQ